MPKRGVKYSGECYGHDEAELSPQSSLPNSASEITWTFVLPTGGTDPGSVRVSDLTNTVWFGATLQDPKSWYKEAFAELQFYPDGAVSHCNSDGDYFQVEQTNTWGACIPVFAVTPPKSKDPFVEYAAYDATVTQSGSGTPLIFHSGDTVTVHYFRGAQKGTPMNVDVTDVTSGAHATRLVLISKADGPLAPVSGANVKTNFLKWGLTQSPPLSVAWEIGHTSVWNYPDAEFCDPGGFNCFSYNVSSGWDQITPLHVTSAVFAGGAKPSTWTVNDGEGGITEVITTCGFFDAPASNGFCTYPYYSYNDTAKALDFGGTYDGTTATFNEAHQFPLDATCPQPKTTFKVYCSTTLNPTPPIP